MPRMPNYRTTDSVPFSLPPIRGVVKWLMIANLGIFVVYELIGLANPNAAAWVELHFALQPHMVIRGAVWELVTYAFLHLSVGSILWNLLGLWLLGYMVEGLFGQRFLQYYLTCVVGGALGVTAIAYSGAVHDGPLNVIGGSTAALYGLLLAIGVLMPEAEFLLFFFIRIKAKYMVAIILVSAVLISLAPGAVLYFGEFGGLIAGFLYIKYWGRRAALRSAAAVPHIGRGLSDREYTPRTEKASFLARWRDAYYRWKRRRAARKFEIYMSKHDRKVYFDEHGNYIDPESAENRRRDDDDKKPWVN